MRKRYIGFIVGLLVLIVVSGTIVTAQKDQEQFKLGLDVLLDEQLDKLSGKNVGLITNPTGVDQNLNSIVDRLNQADGVNLVALYGPEHGVRGDAQAGSYVEYYIDEKTGLPVYSLYGDTRKPTPEMLKDVDVLLFDIQDVGTRFYTYIYTMAYAMEAAAENDIEFIVLDRPNPIGGVEVAGPVLDPDYSTFVGLYPIPLRHGMTVGELAHLFNEEFDLNADIEVIEMSGWKRTDYYDDTPLEWVLPSPNMPTLDTAFVYSGAALIEGTNVSEGRGTTKPFELIGAPFIDGAALADQLNAAELSGVTFRAAYFTPQFSKHSGKLSGGIEIHVTNEDRFDPVKAGITIVKTIHDMYPNDFQFTAFFDSLIGNGWVREKIIAGASVEEISNTWKEELTDFRHIRSNYLLYTTSSAELQETVDGLVASGDIAKGEVEKMLTMHLKAVGQFESKKQNAKITKHMENLYEVLDLQLEQGKISAHGHGVLTKAITGYLGQW